jgi:phenylpyruvate tautomerase PptA (4-oxalocrotonate tautomerase family)
MPLFHVHVPSGTFTQSAQDQLANELIEIALQCEKLPATEENLSLAWVYFNEYPSTHVYHSLKSGGTKVINIYADILGACLDQAAKDEFIKRITDAVGKHTQERFANGEIPLFILIRDVLEPSWGVFCQTASLKMLRESKTDSPSLG